MKTQQYKIGDSTLYSLFGLLCI